MHKKMETKLRQTLREKPEWLPVLAASFMCVPLLFGSLLAGNHTFLFFTPVALLFISFGTILDKTVKILFIKNKQYKAYSIVLFLLNSAFSILLALNLIHPVIALTTLAFLATYWVYLTISTYTHEQTRLFGNINA